MYEKERKYLCFNEKEIDKRQGIWFFENVYDSYCGVESRLPNCVSLHIEENDYSVLAKCMDFLCSFPFILLAGSEEMIKEAKKYITGVPILAITDHTPIKEIFEKRGACGLEELLKNARELPAEGLLNIADVTPVDVSRVPRVFSGINDLDYYTGGFLMGDVSVWTGKRGEGKSTFLSQMLIEAVDYGYNVCAYSGELSAARFQNWLYLQTAGKDHIVEKLDQECQKIIYEVDKEAAKKINCWYDHRFFLYDLGISTAHNADSILKVFEYAARRYLCSVFLVDNIMTARFESKNEANFYREQSQFVGKMVEFANRFNVHVHIVAHPRKTKSINDSDDVSGIADITNRAANVFSLARVPEREAEEKGYGSVLSILKNRAYGERANIGLNYEAGSRRYYKSGFPNPNKKYRWEKMK